MADPSRCRTAPIPAAARRVRRSDRSTAASASPAHAARAKTRKTEPLVGLAVPPSLHLTPAPQPERISALERVQHLVFQHRVMVAALLQKPIASALSLEEESQQWSILPGWTCRWRKRRFASWDETALSSTRRRCRLRRRISRPSLRSFQPADASYSRPAEWLRCSIMVYANSDCRLSASRAGRRIRR